MSDASPFDPHGTLGQVPDGWWLVLQCQCGRSARIPRGLLAEAHRPQTRVSDLLTRLRCMTCRASPVSAEWMDNPAGHTAGGGYDGARRVPLALNSTNCEAVTVHMAAPRRSRRVPSV